MKSIYFKNLKIDNFQPNINRAVIVSQAGYTPKRNFFLTGSGLVTVPNGIIINFYTEHNKEFNDLRFINLYNSSPEKSIPVICETFLENDKIQNYSLTKGDLYTNNNDSLAGDFALISVMTGKAHLSDIFNFCKNNKINIIHYFSSRLNKLNLYGNTKRNAIPQKFAFRADTRGPEVILKDGFEGSKCDFFNLTFKSNTVFASEDEEGMMWFALQEIGPSIKKRNGALSAVSNFYHNENYIFLYKIDITGLDYFQIFSQKNTRNFSEKYFQQIKINGSTRNDEYIKKRISQFLDMGKETLFKNHEITIRGPIPGNRISYLKKISLSDI